MQWFLFYLGSREEVSPIKKPLIKLKYAVRNSVACNRNLSAHLAGEACIAADGGNSELSVGFFVLFLKVIPYHLLLFDAFLASLNAKENGADGQHKRKFVEHISVKRTAVFLDAVKLVGIYHKSGNEDLLIDSLYHILLADRLLVASDVVEIHIEIHIIYAHNVGEGNEHIEVVNIEGMLRQLELKVAKQLRSVNYGVHHKILRNSEGICVVPSAYFLDGENVLVAYNTS